MGMGTAGRVAGMENLAGRYNGVVLCFTQMGSCQEAGFVSNSFYDVSDVGACALADKQVRERVFGDP
jgi:hypothetical protein